MSRLALLLAALVLLALGGWGLYNADRNSATDFVVAGAELIAGLALLGSALVIARRGTSGTEPSAAAGRDREEVLARLQRHTQGFHAGGEHDAAARSDLEPSEPLATHDSVGLADVSESDRPASNAVADAHQPEDGDRAAGDVRLPALMLLNVGGDAGPGDIESAPPLGSRDDVLAKLRDIVPDLAIDATGRTEHRGPDHSVRLDLGAAEPVHTVVIEAAGRTGISLVRWLMESTGWRAFVPKSGRFVEPDALDGIATRDAAE